MAFKVPESLEGLTADELNALIAEARTELAALNISAESSDEDLAAAEALVDAKAAIEAQVEAVAQADAERAERVARLTDAAKEPEAPAAEEAPAEEAPAEDKELVEASTETITPDEVDGEPLVAEEAEKVAVTASSTPVQRAASNALPVDYAPPKPGIALTAAANVPGIPDGKTLESMDDIVEVIAARIKGMPKHNLATAAGGHHQRFGAVSIHRDPADAELVQGATGNDWDLVERAGDERRLPGGSLTAAALVPGVTGPAWCSPSETFYDLCEVEDVTGMWDVPEFTVSRGGIRYTKGPIWADVYGDSDRGFFIDNTGQTVTNGKVADALDLKDADGASIAPASAGQNPKKPCIMVDCYPWEEIRMECDGVCIKSPLLLEVTYPELIRRFTEMVLVAHRHDVNRRQLAQLEAAAIKDIGGTVPAGTTPAPDRTVFNMRALEFQAIALRYKYRKPENATMEVILPNWAKTLIGMDLAMENGSGHCASDAEVNAWFTCRNMRVQWVYDWQDIVVGPDLEITWPNLKSGTPGTTPESVRAIMYPAGTWTRGTADVINLDTVYDSASLADNVFTALFMEECDLLVQRCTESSVIDIDLCTTGTGVLDIAAACATSAYV